MTCNIVDIQQSGCVRHYITDKYRYFRIHDSFYGIVMIYTDFLQKKFEVVVEIPQAFLFNLSLSIVKKT
jgi:hypothetical protein